MVSVWQTLTFEADLLNKQRGFPASHDKDVF